MSNPRINGWTAQARSAFLASLAACGTVRGAAQSVNRSAQAAYTLRARDPAFARAWDAALGIARDHLVAHLTNVAFEGWTEEVWFRGELVGERTRHNPMVAMRLLERLDRMAEAQAAPIQRFDTLLRAESVGVPIHDPQVRGESDLEEQATAAECNIRLHRARELNQHLATLRAAAPPPLCGHEDCCACHEAAEALCLDPTADIATAQDGTVLGCLHPDDLPDDDVRIGTIFDPYQAAREEAAMLADLGLTPAPGSLAERYMPAITDETDDEWPEDQDDSSVDEDDRAGDQLGAKLTPLPEREGAFRVTRLWTRVGRERSDLAAKPQPATLALSHNPTPSSPSQSAHPEPVEGSFRHQPDAESMVLRRVQHERKIDNEALLRAHPEPVEGSNAQGFTPNPAQPELVEGPRTNQNTPADPTAPRCFPALECQPASTCAETAAPADDPPDIEKAAPSCEDAAHSVQPDGAAD